jgi:hypothetical protein
MSAIDIPADFAALHDREWDRLSRPGTWFTGAERVAIAIAARGEAASSPAQRAASVISTAPATITRDWFDALLADGLSAEQYVEVLGIVARLRALDTTRFGLGHLPRPLPAPDDGNPTPITTEAVIDGSWVPTIGVAFPPTILSAVPQENEAMFDVHGTLYLTPDHRPEGSSMGNMSAVREGLNRSQMEFVAARTSLLNDCFF